MKPIGARRELVERIVAPLQALQAWRAADTQGAAA
jgi:hypothetical protein